MAHNHTTLHKVSHAEKEKTRLRTTLERDPGSGVSAWRMVSSSATGLTLIRKMPSVPTELPAASLWNSSQQLQVCSICSWPRCNESACRVKQLCPPGSCLYEIPFSFSEVFPWTLLDKFIILKQHPHCPILDISKQLTMAVHTDRCDSILNYCCTQLKSSEFHTRWVEIITQWKSHHNRLL